MQPTGAEWRSLGRCTSVRVRLRSSSRCWTKRLFWRQKAWSNLCLTCTVAFWQTRRYVSHSLPRARHASLDLWLLEVLAARILCFDGPESPWETGTWSRTICPRPVGSTRSTASFSPLRRPGGAGAVLDYFVVAEAMAHLVQQVEVVDNSPTTPHWPVRLTVKATSWGHRVLARKRPKPFLTEALWVRSARRSASIGPGRQRNPPTIWSWHGWSGCAKLQRGAAFTTSTELSAGPSWEGAKGWSSSTFPSAQVSRKDTRRSCSKKAGAWRSLRRLVAQAVGNLAAWRNGRTSQYTTQRSVHTIASISLLDLGPWDPGWDFPSQEALTHTSCNVECSGDWADQVTRVMLFIMSQKQQVVNAAAADSARCWGKWAKEAYQGSAGAGHASSQGRSCWSTKCGHGCRYGWMGARRMPCSWPTRRTGENFCHDLHSERSTKFARRTRATAGLGHDCINPKGCSAVVGRTASATHRFAHGFRGQAGQTPVQGKHEGFEPQAIRRSSHNRPHGCSVTYAVPFTQAAGTSGRTSTMRPTSGAPWARRATV